MYIYIYIVLPSVVVVVEERKKDFEGLIDVFPS